MDTIASFKPISSPDSKVLVLGTMPGEASLLAQEYYRHPDNLFWDIMFRVLDSGWDCEKVVDVDYQSKVKLLLQHRIALWDVLQFCDRKGNLDAAIRNEIKNGFPDFLSKHPRIKAIFFNGQKAHKYFLELKTPSFQLPVFVLPSTSPSNTQNSFWILSEWTAIRQFIRP